jgi:hypothetical protein
MVRLVEVAVVLISRKTTISDRSERLRQIANRRRVMLMLDEPF